MWVNLSLIRKAKFWVSFFYKDDDNFSNECQVFLRKCQLSLSFQLLLQMFDGDGKICMSQLKMRLWIDLAAFLNVLLTAAAQLYLKSNANQRRRGEKSSHDLNLDNYFNYGNRWIKQILIVYLFISKHLCVQETIYYSYLFFKVSIFQIWILSGW